MRGAGPFYGFAENASNGPRWTGKVRLIPEKLEEPLSWRKPRLVFVNSMSDLFHENLSDEDIWKVFDVMSHAGWHRGHTFLVLTKRPLRMLKFCKRMEFEMKKIRTMKIPLPVPCVWLGVSIEDQDTANERIPLLLKTPAALRFISYEPALGPVDLTEFFRNRDPRKDRDWVIVGGESGPSARECDIEWIRSAVKQCRDVGIPCFVKQLGAHPYEGHSENDRCCERSHLHPGCHPLGRLDPDGITRSLRDRKGGDPSEWPEDLRVREWPE